MLRALISQAGVGLVSASVRVSKGDNDMKTEVPGAPWSTVPDALRRDPELSPGTRLGLLKSPEMGALWCLTSRLRGRLPHRHS